MPLLIPGRSGIGQNACQAPLARVVVNIMNLGGYLVVFVAHLGDSFSYADGYLVRCVRRNADLGAVKVWNCRGRSLMYYFSTRDLRDSALKTLRGVESSIRMVLHFPMSKGASQISRTVAYLHRPANRFGSNMSGLASSSKRKNPRSGIPRVCSPGKGQSVPWRIECPHVDCGFGEGKSAAHYNQNNLGNPWGSETPRNT